MSNGFDVGTIVYAGYPHAHVFNFYRNSKNKLTFGKVKHLLWGDWIKVSDYDYAQDPEADIRTADETTLVADAAAGMVPVRVRGVSGYMHAVDLQKDRLLEIVFVDVGQGDGALVVTPDDKKYVIDAGVSDHMYRYLKWRFAGFEKSHTDFDGFIITHPDKDHYFGFNSLVDDSKVRATNIWHSGLVEQFGFTESGAQSTSNSKLLGKKENIAGQAFLIDLIESDGELGDFLANQDRWIKQSTGNPKQYPDLLNSAFTATDGDGNRRFSNIEMLSTGHGEFAQGQTWLPGFSPDNADGCTIEVIGPVVESDNNGNACLRTFSDKPMKKTTSIDAGKTKNGHSILLRLTYGKTSILFGGDLNSPAEMFLLRHYTDLPVYDGTVSTEDIVQAGRPVFGADIAKACHHGSADFTDAFLACIHSAATVISSGDEESHAHPRCDTLGAVGHHGRGHRSLIFSTELARSTREFTDRKDSPWFQAYELKLKAEQESDDEKKAEMLEKAEELFEQDRKINVTVYGSINLRSDGNKTIVAYMLEKPSRSRRWDIYPMESTNGGPLHYLPLKEAEKAELERRSPDVQ